MLRLAAARLSAGSSISSSVTKSGAGDGEHIGQRRAHRLRDVQERVGRKPRALPVFIGDVEYGVRKAAVPRARRCCQTKPQALIRFFDEFSGILRSVDAAGGSGVVGVDNLALPYQNDRLGKGIEQFEFSSVCPACQVPPFILLVFYRIGLESAGFMRDKTGNICMLIISDFAEKCNKKNVEKRPKQPFQHEFLDIFRHVW